MRYFSYVVARDFGFAPNPFYGVCTLATCKARIRQAAGIGDWVIGTGSASYQLLGKLVYLMRVTEKMTFDQYWNDLRYIVKRPVMNGSLKKLNGDNIYRADGVGWKQADSHHSHENGVTNWDNYNRDTKADAVLISTDFYYFGGAAITIPSVWRGDLIKKGVGYRCPEHERGERLVRYVRENYDSGYQAEPASFRNFKRYNGK